jgi:N-acetyl-anhydromuramyl-L-alanine amidase AmpD
VPRVRRWRSASAWDGRPYGPPVAFVLHTTGGGQSGTVAEFLCSSSMQSTHYAANLDGSLDCYIDPADRARANGLLERGNRWTAVARACGLDPALDPNHVTISCDAEDAGDPDAPIPVAQLNAVGYALWEAKLRYPQSLQFVVGHADISPQSRPCCPGTRWLASGQLQHLADTLGLKTTLQLDGLRPGGLSRPADWMR